MADADGPLAGVGRPRRRERSVARRAGSWLAWWVVLTAFWVGVDYSLDAAELLVGAAVAAVAASLVELIGYQADIHFRMRALWLPPAFALPGRVARDTCVVFAALYRRVVHGTQPASGFVEVPAAWGEDSASGLTRRVARIGGSSVAPNTIALGLDRDRDTLVTHQLVRERER